MAGAKLVRTRWPGIYRRGAAIVFEYTDGQGRRRRETVDTIEAARAGKARREEEARFGGSRADARQPFGAFALEWVERYQGKGRNGFRENTRDDYRRDITRYAIVFWGAKVKISELTPRHIADFVAWLCDDQAQLDRHELEVKQRRRANVQRERDGDDHLRALRAPGPLADATVRRILCPVRACLGTAMREGVIGANPAAGAALPHRPDFDGDDPEDKRALTEEQLAAFLGIVNARHRLLFRLLASTGLRISEALALQWRHLKLDGSEPHVRVRRAYVKGVMGPPKSRHGRREVPIGAELVQELRAQRAGSEWPRAEDLVFAGRGGALMDQSSLRRDALVPAAEEAGAPWAGFHTFRHTCASLLFARGRNAKQVQRWLGHHSPAFTLATYVHLLDDELGDALELPTATVTGSDGGRLPHAELDLDQPKSVLAEPGAAQG